MHELCSGRSSPPNSIPRQKEVGNRSCFEENETESMRIFSCGSCSIYIIAFGRGMDSAKELKRLLLLLLLMLEAVAVSGPFLLLRWGRTGMLGCLLSCLCSAEANNKKCIPAFNIFTKIYDMTTNNLEMPMWPIVFRLLFVALAAAAAVAPRHRAIPTYLHTVGWMLAGCTAPTNGDGAETK